MWLVVSILIPILQRCYRAIILSTRIDVTVKYLQVPKSGSRATYHYEVAVGALELKLQSRTAYRNRILDWILDLGVRHSGSLLLMDILGLLPNANTEFPCLPLAAPLATDLNDNSAEEATLRAVGQSHPRSRALANVDI
jgi:hypothetical protein